jgi:transposase
MGIIKRGDSYLRTFLIHGARAVVRIARKYQHKHNQWISKLVQRRGNNISAIWVANKNVCIARALLSKRESY